MPPGVSPGVPLGGSPAGSSGDPPGYPQAVVVYKSGARRKKKHFGYRLGGARSMIGMEVLDAERKFTGQWIGTGTPPDNPLKLIVEMI